MVTRIKKADTEDVLAEVRGFYVQVLEKTGSYELADKASDILYKILVLDLIEAFYV